MAEKKQTFEQSMAQLERGDVPLEEALSLFDEGTALMKKCSGMLDKAEQKIVKLTAGPDGKPVESRLDGEG